MRNRAVLLAGFGLVIAGCNHEFKSHPPKQIDRTEVGWYDDGKGTKERFQSRDVEGVSYEWSLDSRD